METYTTRRNSFGKLCGNSNSANLTVGDELMNANDKQIISKRKWTFTKKTKNFTTTTSQSSLTLPHSVKKVNSIFLLSGTTRYRIQEVTDRAIWVALTQSPADSAVYPNYFYVRGNVVEFYPIISTASNTLTIEYTARQKDLSIADYTTGTIVSIANGATTVTGTGTTWTSKMIGRFIRITDSDTANAGDGEWYEIASVTSTTILELTTNYQGVSIAAATVAYTIGQVSLIPEEYQPISKFWALADYFMSGINPKMDRSDRWRARGGELYDDMVKDYSSATGDISVSEDVEVGLNSNNYPHDLS